MIHKQSLIVAARRVLLSCVLVAFTMSLSAQSFRSRRGAFDGGDDYHFGYISGSVGYSMLQTGMTNVLPKGNVGGSVGLGYEFRNSGFWANVGLQMSFHRSSLILDEYDTFNPSVPFESNPFIGNDSQGNLTAFQYKVRQTDEMQWNFLDVPVMAGYYVRGFHIGGGLKVSYALNPKTRSYGTYELSASNQEHYPIRFENMPDRGYKEYEFDNQTANRLNVGVSLIGEIGYDLLSSVPTRSRICNVLKLSFYFEYGLNNYLRNQDQPDERVFFPERPYDPTQPMISSLVNTLAKPARTVPFFTGVKLTYMIGGSRTARVGYHHGCMCYQ